jgi:hypothetical protein
MSNQDIVPVSSDDNAIEKIKAEIDKGRKLQRPEYSLRLYVVHAPWLGQKKLFDQLNSDYQQETKVFLVREPYGRLNDPSSETYFEHKLFFMLMYAAKIGDLEAFKRDCIWDEAHLSGSEQLKIAEEWAKGPKLPDGKVTSEYYAALMFDKSLVYGVMDNRIRKILNNKIAELGPYHQIVHQLQDILIEKAFLNTIAIMDSAGVKQAVAIIDAHWRSFYENEARLRKMVLETTSFLS